MTLFIGDKLIQKADNFSDAARLTLAFIDGGVEWTRWAMTAKTSPYAFANEDAFLDALQQGLHGSRFTLLPKLGLMVSPVKLSGLNPTELFNLQEAEAAGPVDAKVTARAQRVLERHDLRTAQDLALVDVLLQRLGVANAPLFQALGFSERLALYHLMSRIDPDDTPPNVSDLDIEAAAFAIREARAPLEFIDYFHVYRDLANKPHSNANTPEKRERNASHAIHNLLPLMFYALSCPQVPGLVSPDEVAQAVKFWTATGKSIGFARASAGVREIVAHTIYRGQPGQAALECFSAYRKGSRDLLENAEISHGIMGQDGATCVFPVSSVAHEAWLKLDPEGVISLTLFKPKVRPSLAGDPFKSSDEPQLEQAS